MSGKSVKDRLGMGRADEDEEDMVRWVWRRRKAVAGRMIIGHSGDDEQRVMELDGTGGIADQGGRGGVVDCLAEIR